MFSLLQTLQTFETSSPTTPSSSMTQSLFSAPFPIKTSNNFVAQAIWTGTPVGSIAVVGSLDGVNFNIPMTTQAVAGAPGSFSYDLWNTGVLYVQITYTFTSGSGTLTCNFSTKVGP